MSPEDGEFVVIVMERGSLEGSCPATVIIQHQSQGEEATARDNAAGKNSGLAFGDVLVSPARPAWNSVGPAVSKQWCCGLASARAHSRSHWRLRQRVSPTSHQLRELR